VILTLGCEDGRIAFGERLRFEQFDSIHVGYNAPMRRFRFSLLALLLLLTVVAVAIVWGRQWIELQHLRRENRALWEEKLSERRGQLQSLNKVLSVNFRGRNPSREQLEALREVHEDAIAEIEKRLEEL
jgi:hypothetical protein